MCRHIACGSLSQCEPHLKDKVEHSPKTSEALARQPRTSTKCYISPLRNCTMKEKESAPFQKRCRCCDSGGMRDMSLPRVCCKFGRVRWLRSGCGHERHPPWQPDCTCGPPLWRAHGASRGSLRAACQWSATWTPRQCSMTLPWPRGRAIAPTCAASRTEAASPAPALPLSVMHNFDITSPYSGCSTHLGHTLCPLCSWY